FDPEELDVQMREHRSDMEMTERKISKGELASGVEKTDLIKEKRIAELELRKISEFQPKDEAVYSRNEIIEGQLDKTFTEKKIVFADARLDLRGKIYTLDQAIQLLEREQVDAKIKRVDQGLAALKLLSPQSGIVTYADPGFFFGGSRVMPGRFVYIGMM